jgi:hypothetical protein
MSFNIFKIDTWWKAVLALGLISCIGATITSISIVENKHLFGLGMGLLCIGLSHWMAWKTAVTNYMNGFLSWNIIKHNPVSYLLLITGITLTILFGYLIVRALI